MTEQAADSSASKKTKNIFSGTGGLLLGAACIGAIAWAVYSNYQSAINQRCAGLYVRLHAQDSGAQAYDSYAETARVVGALVNGSSFSRACPHWDPNTPRAQLAIVAARQGLKPSTD